MNKINKKILIITVIITVLLITIGVSFAYFTAIFEGGEDSTTITVKSGSMVAHFDGGSIINLQNIIPSDNAVAVKTFTVTGNGNTNSEMFYRLNMIVDSNNFSEDALKYKLISTNSDNNGTPVPTINELTNIGTGTKTIELGIGKFTTPTRGNKVHTYNLEIHFPNTKINQNDDQGKVFKAHITIINYYNNGSNPSESGNNLRDQILAQGGGAEAIESKGNPNFVNASPLPIYEDVISAPETSSMKGNYNYYTGTGYIFNTSTGRYTLTNHTRNDYGENHIGHYTCGTLIYKDCIGVYKINAVEGTTVTNRTKHTAAGPTFDYSETGLYSTEDEYGTSYYYRGDKNLINNNLIWGNFQWQIIRINGDGSIRLIYNGDADIIENGGISTYPNPLITQTSWNDTNFNDPKYVGYMYGGLNGEVSTSREEAVLNETNNNAKTVLENWYETNIAVKSINSQVVDNLFCNDRQLQSEIDGPISGPGYGNHWTNAEDYTYYAAYHRLFTNKTPTLKCGLKNDRFTVSDTVKGNGSLTYPIALITADEAFMAGITDEVHNEKNYLNTYSYSSYITLTPSDAAPNGASFMIELYAYYGVKIDKHITSYNYSGLRPVISLSSQTRVTGSGSLTDPFIVITP